MQPPIDLLAQVDRRRREECQNSTGSAPQRSAPAKQSVGAWCAVAPISALLVVNSAHETPRAEHRPRRPGAFNASDDIERKAPASLMRRLTECRAASGGQLMGGARRAQGSGARPARPPARPCHATSCATSGRSAAARGWPGADRLVEDNSTVSPVLSVWWTPILLFPRMEEPAGACTASGLSVAG